MQNTARMAYFLYWWKYEKIRLIMVVRFPPFPAVFCQTVIRLQLSQKQLLYLQLLYAHNFRLSIVLAGRREKSAIIKRDDSFPPLCQHKLQTVFYSVHRLFQRVGSRKIYLHFFLDDLPDI